MNILFVFRDDNTNGGASSIMRQVIEYYISHESVVHIVFLRKKEYGHFDDIVCDNLKLYFGGNLFRFIKILIIVHKIYFDYSFNSVVKFTGLVGLLKRLGILHINTTVGRESTSIFLRFHGLRLLYYKLWYMIGYKAVNVLICQSDIMKKQLLEHLPWLEHSARVIVNPNPVNVLQMNNKADEVVEGIPDCPFVVTAGRFIPEKAYDVLLNSFEKLLKNHNELKLVILGDGTLRNHIEEQINSLQLNDKVILMGQVDNVYPWFRKAALCVVSSRMEGFPNVLLQMMSQNEKVVSTLCAGGIENIKGLITCPVNDSVTLYEAMAECLEADSTRCRALFDEELENRSIDNYMYRIEHNTI